MLPNYMGSLISQYKDPYKPTSIMESRRVFFVAHMSFGIFFSSYGIFIYLLVDKFHTSLVPPQYAVRRCLGTQNPKPKGLEQRAWRIFDNNSQETWKTRQFLFAKVIVTFLHRNETKTP